MRAGYISLWILSARSPLMGCECFSLSKAIFLLGDLLQTFSHSDFRNCSLPYSLTSRGGNHSSLTLVVPEYKIISGCFFLTNIIMNHDYITITSSLFVIILLIASCISYIAMIDKRG